ncbi:hypothetical protein OESDEN_16445 [Oesophagostomum dentatum]|uniref:Uncharacterized protein n=1 Tax=Oesophagostomum dentatum TaxID=61180 RepID=A0A0B1SKV1_OESDE|nr:hypothetical protein OESDEN_16445 [Oesophagostomum dentatum]
MLPTPKGPGRKIDLGGPSAKGTGLMLPPSMRNKPSSSSAPVVQPAKESAALKRPAATSDDSDDDDLPTDFFGLSSAPEPKIPRVGDIPALVNGVADVMGPSRPAKQEDYVGAYGYPEVEPSSSAMPAPPTEGIITDEEAHRLIMKYEVTPMGIDQRTYNSTAADIVDIRVDDALGPDVHATLLKNLHTTARDQRRDGSAAEIKEPSRCNIEEKASNHIFGELGRLLHEKKRYSSSGPKASR